jgi:ribonuclease Z
MHGDHVFGLPGLLASLGLAGTCSGIDLYGPDPLRDYLEGVLRTSSTRIGYPLRSHRVKDAATSGAVLLDDDDITVRCTTLIHRVPAYAYRVDQKPRAGRFDVEQARALGIPPGPIYAELKAGREVVLDDGRIINGASLCGPERPGCSVVYCTDTVFSEAAVELAQGADLLIHESTFSHAEAEMAIARQHSTSTMAAQTALAAGVKQLMLTHLSPRYVPGNPVTPDDLLNWPKTSSALKWPQARAEAATVREWLGPGQPAGPLAVIQGLWRGLHHHLAGFFDGLFFLLCPPDPGPGAGSAPGPAGGPGRPRPGCSVDR